MSLIDRCRERCRHSEEEEGFTLIELLVVLLIIGILLAIAIPTFLSVTKGANGTAAESNLQTALTGGDTYFTDNNQSYSGIMSPGFGVSTLTQINTGLTYQVSTVATNNTHNIIYTVGTNSESIGFMAFAPGQNRCYGVVDVKATGSAPTGVTLPSGATTTWYGYVATSSGQCTGADLTKISSTAGTAGAWQDTGFPK